LDVLAAVLVQIGSVGFDVEELENPLTPNCIARGLFALKMRPKSSVPKIRR